MEFFQLANLLEAGLWFVIALTIAWSGAKRANVGVRRRSLVLAMAFAIFGVSDIVETQTGAWWRPWWLLVWKTACVLVFVGYAVQHYRERGEGNAR